MFFVSVASKGFRFSVSPLFSALTSRSPSVDSKRVRKKEVAARGEGTEEESFGSRWSLRMSILCGMLKVARAVSGTSKLSVNEHEGE